jgi:hypothetical protein
MEATMKVLPADPIRRAGIFIVLSALALWLSPLASAQQTASPPSPLLALIGGTVYPAPRERPIPNGIVLIKNGKILGVGEKGKMPIPAGTQIIDCTGRSIAAGF